MKKNETPNTYCLIESSGKNRLQILTMLISINLCDNGSNVIVSCCKNTEVFINEFPLDFRINIKYLTNIKDDGYKFRILDIINTFYYCIDNFGEFIYLDLNIILTRKIIVPERIKKQNFGIVKKIFNSHEKENNKKRFVSDILYCSKREIVDKISLYYNLEKMSPKEIAEKYYGFGYNFTHEFQKFNEFFDEGFIIYTEDFVSFSNSLDIKHISNDLVLKKKINIHCFSLNRNSKHNKIKEINNNILKIIIQYKPEFYPITHLFSSGKVIFRIPYKKNIGIWNRVNYNPDFYNVIQYFCENNKHFCSFVFKANHHYFSVSNYLLLDFPSIQWLAPDVYEYRKLLYTDHDSSLMSEIEKINYKGFLFYYSDNAIVSDKFFLKKYKAMLKNNKKRTKDKAFLKRNENNKYLLDSSQIRSYGVLLYNLLNISYVIMDEFDMGLFITVMAAGCIPVLQKSSRKMPTLVEGKHYFVKNIPLNSDIHEVRNNVIEYYKNNCVLDKCFKRLVRHLFVGDI